MHQQIAVDVAVDARLKPPVDEQIGAYPYWPREDSKYISEPISFYPSNGKLDWRANQDDKVAGKREGDEPYREHVG